MTIDSRYQMELPTRKPVVEEELEITDLEYPFTFESIGEDAVRVYLTNSTTGTRVLLTRTDTIYVK